MPTKSIPATRTIVMTGATRGLGHVAAIKLLADAPDAQLVVITRSDSAKTVAELRKASGNPHVSGVTADLSSLDSIRAAATDIKSDLGRKVLPQGGVSRATPELRAAIGEAARTAHDAFAVSAVRRGGASRRRSIRHVSAPPRDASAAKAMAGPPRPRASHAISGVGPPDLGRPPRVMRTAA